MATTIRTYADSDDAGYWAEQRDLLTAPPARTEPASEARDRRIRTLIAMRTDSGLTAEQAAELAALEAEHDAAFAAVRQAAADRFAAEWTPEVTIERRAAWNAALKDPRYNPSGRNVLVGKLEREIGFGFEDLKAAVKLHDLAGK